MTALSRIRQKVIDREYYLSAHAEEEIAEDYLERKDVENAILRGEIDKKMTHDVRGTHYRIPGPAKNGCLVHVVCSFKEVGALIIITVYMVRGE